MNNRKHRKKSFCQGIGIHLFKTDDSHSYRNWNDGPPTGQDDYRITLSYFK